MVPPEAALVYGLSSWIYSRDARSLPPPYFLYKRERREGERGGGNEGGREGDGREGGGIK